MKEEKKPRSPFGRDKKAESIEKYNSRSDRRTSQNGAMAFSAFVFVVSFCAVAAAGCALAGEPVVWVFLTASVVAFFAVMSIHIAMQWEKVVVLRLGKFSRTKGPWTVFHDSLHRPSGAFRRSARHGDGLRRRGDADERPCSHQR